MLEGQRTGFFKADRGFFLETIRARLRNPKYEYALIRLLLSASFADGEYSIAGRKEPARRGQYVATLSYLERLLGMETKEVRCFLAALTREGLAVYAPIRQGKRADGIKITFLCYEEAQGAEGHTEGHTETLMPQGIDGNEGHTEPAEGHTKGHTEGHTETLMPQGIDGNEGHTEGHTKGQQLLETPLPSVTPYEKNSNKCAAQPPTLEEVLQFCDECKAPHERGQAFFEYYAPDWLNRTAGGSIVPYWKTHFLRGIKLKWKWAKKKGQGKTVPAQQYTQRQYTEEELLAVSGDLIEEARKYSDKKVADIMREVEAEQASGGPGAGRGASEQDNP